MKSTLRKAEEVLQALLKDKKCNPNNLYEKIEKQMKKKGIKPKKLKLLFEGSGESMPNWEKNVYLVLLQTVENAKILPEKFETIRKNENNLIKRLSAESFFEEQVEALARETQAEIKRQYNREDNIESLKNMTRSNMLGRKTFCDNAILRSKVAYIAFEAGRSEGDFVPIGNPDIGVFEYVSHGDYDYMLSSINGAYVVDGYKGLYTDAHSEELDCFIEALARLFAKIYLDVGVLLEIHSSPEKVQKIYNEEKEKRPIVTKSRQLTRNYSNEKYVVKKV